VSTESPLFRLLDDLAAFGLDNDARETERARRMLNITPETGRFLAILVRAAGARRLLEIGASNGYSTIWLAWAAQDTGGRVTTIERAPDKIAMARSNLARAGLADRVTVCEGDAHDVLRAQTGLFDFVFLDADRPSYLAYLPRLLSLLKPSGLLVTDNVVSHAHELEEFLARVRSDPSLETVTVPLGHGLELTSKRT
jgi:predicted O-methyltransferase YrrM